jgi:hypothetical protein
MDGVEVALVGVAVDGTPVEVRAVDVDRPVLARRHLGLGREEEIRPSSGAVGRRRTRDEQDVGGECTWVDGQLVRFYYELIGRLRGDPWDIGVEKHVGGIT